MKESFLKISMTGIVVATFMSTAVYAGNSTVENALRDRPDLSMFYQGLVSTGVINELKEGESYTVFAPTNDAFAKLPVDKYPCFYSQACKPEVADILRSHIVPGEKHLSEIGTHVGGIKSMFAINDYHIIGSEPYKNSYAVDGHKVLSENQLPGNVLYRVDGVLATTREMVRFEAPVMAMVHVAGSDQLLPPRVPAGTIVTITVPESPAQ